MEEGDLQEFDKLLTTTKNKLVPDIKQKTYQGGQAIDMFLRNFFIKNKMTETLANFQQ